MTKVAALCAFALLGGSVLAQDADKPAETKATAEKLSREHLLSFIPGTKAHLVTQSGSNHNWTNEPDGKFIASSDGRKYGWSGTTSGTGTGSWRISDEGKYCVQIEWKRDSEKWCSFVWRTADGYALGTEGPKRVIDLTK